MKASLLANICSQTEPKQNMRQQEARSEQQYHSLLHVLETFHLILLQASTVGFLRFQFGIKEPQRSTVAIQPSETNRMAKPKLKFCLFLCNNMKVCPDIQRISQPPLLTLRGDWKSIQYP
ncbi:hypothetical protein XENOCAPTIV_025753 [Xenoophorus captivus]|uniref:Uncharacterized protein n=1 Tax=Xenoophorus captivus TaxID=1517983 RepID=A0ABV0RLW6_9TELE